MVSDIKKAVFEVNGIVTMEALGAILSTRFYLSCSFYCHFGMAYP
ncbi:hypothetical protein CSC14_3906 [Proteus mirabilis]|nr:hypothetical protein CSC14_3906 [Proteus mirabilis]